MKKIILSIATIMMAANVMAFEAKGTNGETFETEGRTELTAQAFLDMDAMLEYANNAYHFDEDGWYAEIGKAYIDRRTKKEAQQPTVLMRSENGEIVEMRCYQ